MSYCTEIKPTLHPPSQGEDTEEDVEEDVEGALEGSEAIGSGGRNHEAKEEEVDSNTAVTQANQINQLLSAYRTVQALYRADVNNLEQALQLLQRSETDPGFQQDRAEMLRAAFMRVNGRAPNAQDGIHRHLS